METVGKVERPSLFAGKFVQRCKVFKSHFASSASPINQAVYNIDWLHRSAGCPKVSFQCMVQPMMNASKRILAKPKCRKEPITPKILRQLAERLKDKSCTASSRTLALCIIDFAGFLPFSHSAVSVLVMFVFTLPTVLYF